MTKSSRIKWVVHVVRRSEAYTGFWWGNLRETDHLGDHGVDVKIILRWILRKWDVGVLIHKCPPPVPIIRHIDV
jgi:hypothetical protein